MPNSKPRPTLTPKKAASDTINLIHASAAKRCAHIKMNSQQCAAPAQHDSDFCIFHAGDYEGRNPVLGVYEDAATIQLEISRTIRSLQNKTLEPPEAGRILYALQVASQNLPHLRDEMPSLEEAFPQETLELGWFLSSRLNPPEDRKAATSTICHELARFVRGEPLYDSDLLAKWLPRLPKLPGPNPPAAIPGPDGEDADA